MKNLASKIVCFGEMLWDILPSGKQAGGAPFNVALHLKNFDLAPNLISKIGEDELGRELFDFVQGKNILTDWIQKDYTFPTGVVYANVKDSSEVSYDIVQPVAWDQIRSNPALEVLTISSDYFIYGSLVARQNPSQEALFKLLEFANYKIFDVNLRPPHYQPECIAQLLSKANMVKMNHHELAEITAWDTSLGGLKDQMMFLKDRYELDKVCISLGEKGACLLAGEAFYEQPAFQIQVLDTIGSGDSFLASFLFKMINKASYAESLRFACATGALVATYRGATPSINQAMIENFMKEKG